MHKTTNQKFNGLTHTLLAFILPLAGLIKIQLVGTLFIHELILFCVILLFLRRPIPEVMWPNVKILIAGILLWLISQIVTDIIRNIDFVDWTRGWSKIIFFLTSFVALLRILNSNQRIFLWIAASTVAAIIRPFTFYEGSLDFAGLWKFGVGYGLLTLFCLIALWRVKNEKNFERSAHQIAFLHFCFGIISFFLNARSVAGITILVSVLIVFWVHSKHKRLKRSLLIQLTSITFVVANILAVVYSKGAESGYFGIEAQMKYQSQVGHGGGVLAILFGGRNESLVSTIAISDSPIIGHGSWAKNFYYTTLLLEIIRENKEPEAVVPDFSELSDGLIPSHSYLLGSWVESGVLGALFWVCVLFWTVIKVLPAAWANRNILGICVMMTLPGFIWNILFSPFGAHVRVDVAGTLAIFAYTTYQFKRMKNENFNRNNFLQSKKISEGLH